MLGGVDGVGGHAGRGPGGAGPSLARGAQLQRSEARQRSLTGPDQLQRVERGHPRPRLLREVEPRPGGDQPRPGGAGGEPQRQALLVHPLLRELLALPLQLHAGHRPGEAGADQIGEQRVLDQLLREEALGETRREDDFKGEPADRLHRTDEDAAGPPGGRRQRQLAQASRQHQPHLGEPDRSHRPQRRQLGQQREDARRLAQRPRGERAQRLQPLAPRGLLGQRQQRIEQRQREVAERLEIAPGPLRPLGAGLVLAAQRLLAAGQLLPLAGHPPLPAGAGLPRVAAADHRRVEQQLLPAPGSAAGGSVGISRRVVVPEVLARRCSRLRGRPLQSRRKQVLSRRRRHPALGLGLGLRRRALAVDVGHLAQREVLGEGVG